MNIAESILHYKFRKYYYEKESFEFDLEEIKALATKILEDFFIQELKEERLEEKKDKAKILLKRLKEIE